MLKGVQTRDILSSNLLIDVKRDIKLEIQKVFYFKINPAEIQDLLYNVKTLNRS